MAKAIEVRGLEELEKQFVKYPQAYNKVMLKTMETGLFVLLENVPPYPAKPAGSTYVRTGMLGRSIGSSEGGGRGGKPDIFTTKRLGFGHEGKIGSRLNYAEKVIGDRGKQQPPFTEYWWRLEQVIDTAKGKVLVLFNKAADRLAAFLEGKNV